LPDGLRTGFFLALRLELKHQFFLEIKNNDLQTATTPSALHVLRPLKSDWIQTIMSAASTAGQLILQIWGLTSLHNRMSQF
jgi:hypothetical protein